jgi:hypothetical protein
MCDVSWEGTAATGGGVDLENQRSCDKTVVAVG